MVERNVKKSHAISRQRPECRFTIVLPTMSHFWGGACPIQRMIIKKIWLKDDLPCCGKKATRTCQVTPVQVYSSTWWWYCALVCTSSSRQWPVTKFNHRHHLDVINSIVSIIKMIFQAWAWVLDMSLLVHLPVLCPGQWSMSQSVLHSSIDYISPDLPLLQESTFTLV